MWKAPAAPAAFAALGGAEPAFGTGASTACAGCGFGDANTGRTRTISTPADAEGRGAAAGCGAGAATAAFAGAASAAVATTAGDGRRVFLPDALSRGASECASHDALRMGCDGSLTTV